MLELELREGGLRVVGDADALRALASLLLEAAIVGSSSRRVRNGTIWVERVDEAGEAGEGVERDGGG
jgi:hypothetical protein